MPIRRVPGTDVDYLLISYDADGRERAEPDGTMLSHEAVTRLANTANGITDVFFTSHGWKGDVKAAIEQYDKWIGAMVALEADRAYAREQRPGFTPLIVGLHWPSLPWGDEDIPAGGTVEPLEREVSAYAHRIADTPDARDAIRSILQTAKAGAHGDTLTPTTQAAYDTLFKESGLGAGDVGAAPGADQDGWNPQHIIDEERANAADGTDDAEAEDDGGGFFASIKDHLLSPLRQASFWAMKKRAHLFGESGGHELLVAMQSAAPETTRFHLMGHSFGCIVVSATIAGGEQSKALSRPVDSLFLVQGALSLWAFAPDIPYAAGTPGYFHRIVSKELVKGPIVTTRSTHDRAVGHYYPRGARLKRQLDLVDMDFPKYGGVGSFGIQGVATTQDFPIKPPTSPYGFQRGSVYNVESSRIIKTGGGASGAHSDIAHPEVAHIFWEAALAGL
ncbi:MAG: hypothetical protein ABJD07_04910 [Gemmatimonadaceae bacterium]